MNDWQTAEARLRQLVRTGDPDGTVTLRWLAELLGEEIESEPQREEDPLRDLTVEEVAEHFRRAPSTVRGWLHAGQLWGYKLNRRDWRVPRAAVAEYEQRQKEPVTAAPEEEVDLSSWRHVYRSVE